MSERRLLSSRMPPDKEPQTRLVACEPLADFCLRLSFDDGCVCAADLTTHHCATSQLPVPADRSHFETARIEPDGLSLHWPGSNLHVDAASLRHLAHRQALEPELQQIWKMLLERALCVEQVALAWGFDLQGG